jgi:g-D-glutamyl-meso-diaminopimelate peptidase
VGRKRQEPRSFADVAKHLQSIPQTYPQLQVETIGTSCLGKSICCWSLSPQPQRTPFQKLLNARNHAHSSQADAGVFLRVNIQASMHANEWITSYALIQWLEQVIQQLNWPVQVDLIPLVNPDGVEKVFHEGRKDWKANARGVDLNDQFPAGWEVESNRRNVSQPGPRDFPGYAPLSEPEAQAVAHFLQRTQPHAVVCLHTQGQEIYYNYRGLEPDTARNWAEQMARAANHALGRGTKGKTSAETGYRAVALADSDAGCKDWFIQETGRPAFTLELGRGVNPLPWSSLNEISTALGAMLDQLFRMLDASRCD